MQQEGTAPLPGRIGPFRILERIGEGGMGAVYLAEQDSPHRRVALKVIRAEASSEKLLRRFEREAELLGRLQHHGIAQIFQAGTHETPHGVQPYFAMEYVRGQRLDEYARLHELGTRERLELAALICDAVEYAHQNGVIHRDLKPGNILVTAEGLPKVLDFGVARLADQESRSTMHTDVGALLGTLPYMSPEQASGDPNALDTRSDVYSLGVLFFELLTGHLPYKVERRMLPEAVRVIREDEPDKLSTHDKSLRGDVETIVAKALEKDKQRRYPSASALAADIRRALADEPITARPPSAWYQLSKFAHRNQALVAGAAATFVALVAGTVVATTQAVRARKAEKLAQTQTGLALERLAQATKAEEETRAQRDRAEQAETLALERLERSEIEQKKAAEAASFLESIFAGIDPYQALGADTTLLHRILADAENRISTDLAGQPEVEASIRRTLGVAYVTLVAFERADGHLQRALELDLELFGPDDERTMTAQQSIAKLLFARGDHAGAEAMLREIHARQERLFGPDAPATLDTERELADNLARRGLHAEAERIFREVLARQQDLESALETKGSLAICIHLQGKHDEAEELLGEVLFEHSEREGKDSVPALVALENLALVVSSQGRPTEAEGMHRDALDGLSRIFGAENPFTLNVVNNLGLVIAEQGRTEEAEQLLRECLESRRRVLGPRHADTLRSMSALATHLIEQGRFEEALPLVREALDVQVATLGNGHNDTQTTRFRLAELLKVAHRYGEAAELLHEIVEFDRTALGESHPDFGVALYNWAGTLQDAGDSEGAEKAYREVLELRERHSWPDSPFVASAINGLAKVLERRGERMAAEALFEEALALRRDLFGREEVVHSLFDYGEALLDRGSTQRAEPLLVELCEILPAVKRDNDWRIASGKSLLGRCLALEGRFAEAAPLLEDACVRVTTNPDPLPSVRENALLWTAEMYAAWELAEPGAGHADKGAKWRALLAATPE